MSLNIERSNLSSRPKGNSKIRTGNAEFEIRNWDFSVPTIVGLVLLSSFSAIGQQPTDAKVEPRVPRAEFVAPPSASSAAAEAAPAPSILPPAPPKAVDVLASASTKAKADLDAALKELTATRDKIAAEKVPLSKKLSLAEDDLALARKELDLAQRARDMKNLDQSSLKAEIKQREEETTYMLNLLNEFGRNFGEKSIHISERAGHREKLDLAKATHENTTAAHEDKFKASFRIVDAALTRFGRSVGGPQLSGRGAGCPRRAGRRQVCPDWPDGAFLVGGWGGGGVGLGSEGIERNGPQRGGALENIWSGFCLSHVWGRERDRVRLHHGTGPEKLRKQKFDHSHLHPRWADHVASTPFGDCGGDCVAGAVALHCFRKAETESRAGGKDLLLSRKRESAGGDSGGEQFNRLCREGFGVCLG